MADYVLDASVALGWVLRSQATPAADALLARAATLDFVAPAHFALEVRSGLLKVERQSVVTAAQTASALHLLCALNVTFCPTADADLTRALELARSHAISIYDAVYLGLSMSRSLPLASRDARLLEAAHAAGIPVYDAMRPRP